MFTLPKCRSRVGGFAGISTFFIYFDGSVTDAQLETLAAVIKFAPLLADSPGRSALLWQVPTQRPPCRNYRY